MPSFSQQAISFLAALALTSSITTTTTTVVCTNDFKFSTRRETRKFSKKKNEAQRVCTWRNFAGSSKYRNCQKIEIKIDIGCGDEDADDTTRMCKVTEHPWNDEQKEEDTTACVVHGLFDPKTHITTDSATGLCHLKFLSLLDSCDVDANSSPSGLFGMKAEIHNSRNTENHNDNNSGMMIRFSRTGGAKYYNDDNPRETVPLHDILPAERKLQDDTSCDQYTTCYTPEGTLGLQDPLPVDTSCSQPTPCETFNEWSCDQVHGIGGNRCIDKNGNKERKFGAFDTCFGLGSPNGNRCWSKSHHYGGWFICVPRDTSVHGENKAKHWYVAQPLDDGSCGKPCTYGFTELIFYPGDDPQYSWD